MSKKLILILVMVFSLSVSHFARADVIINEVAWMGTETSQYEEWIELKNTGSESVSLAGWKLYKSGGILLFSLSKTIPASGYFLVCRTTPSVVNPLSGICDEQGTFGGSGLNNTSDLVQLKNASDIEINLVNGVGGWPAGNAVTKETMQKSGSDWITAVATPKAQNQTSAVTPVPTGPVGTGALVNTNSDSDNSSTATTETKTKTPEVLKIKTQIISKTLGFVGLPLSFQATAFGYSGEQLHFGKYFWNFGDGDSKGVKLADSQSFTHTYFYPGDYIVSLDYYQNYYSDTPDASNQITIKIIPADISISGVGGEKDFFVELANNTDYGADISNWIIASATKSFTIPRNTILASKKKMIISPKITNFSIADQDTLKLMTPEREIAFDYVSSVAPVKAVVVNSPAVKPLEEKISMNLNEPVKNLPASTSSSLGGLASVVSSDVAKNDGTSSLYATIIFIISFVFVGVAAGTVYFIRQKKIIPQAGSDFEILDE